MSQIDILSIDAEIKRKFKEEIDNLPQYIKQLSELKSTIGKDNLSTRSYRNLQHNINELEEKILMIKTERHLNFYIAETAHLLETYKKILQTPEKISFTGNTYCDNKEKNKVITKYNEIVQKYTNINIVSPKKSKIVSCNNCCNKNLFDIIDNSVNNISSVLYKSAIKEER